LKRKTLGQAKLSLTSAGCSLGRVVRAYSRLRKGLVVAQSPRAGTSLAQGAPVGVTVSRGRRP